MSDLAVLTARLTQIRSTLATVSAPVPAAGRGGAPGAPDFATTLASATGALGSTTGASAVTSASPVSGASPVTGASVTGARPVTAADTATATAVRPTALRTPATAYDDLFAAASERYQLPAGLLRSVAQAESGFDAGARSPAGAVGLMQMMPATARELDVDPSDPAQAVEGAARLLRQHLDTFGSVPLALAAYNAGPGAVRRYDGVPPYAETRAYVQRVTAAMRGASA